MSFSPSPGVPLREIEPDVQEQIDINDALAEALTLKTNEITRKKSD